MMEQKDMPKCDMCDKPATNLARDVLRDNNRETGWAEFMTSSVLKAGCDDHPVKSIEHKTALPLPKTWKS